MTAPVQSCQPSTADDYAYRFQYADGSAFQIYADGAAFIVFKDGRREQKFGVIDSRIQLLIGRVAKPRQDEIAALRSQVSELRDALREISTHWANQYDHPRKENEMYRGSYGIGVTDGHRACKIIADKALAVNSQHSDGEAGR